MKKKNFCMLQDPYLKITSLGRSRTTRTDLKSYFEDQVFEQSVSNFGKYIPALWYYLITLQFSYFFIWWQYKEIKLWVCLHIESSVYNPIFCDAPGKITFLDKLWNKVHCFPICSESSHITAARRIFFI